MVLSRRGMGRFIWEVGFFRLECCNLVFIGVVGLGGGMDWMRCGVVCLGIVFEFGMDLLGFRYLGIFRGGVYRVIGGRG